MGRAVCGTLAEGMGDEGARPTTDVSPEMSKDLLLILFKGLSIEELATVLLVCKVWRAAALDPLVPAWRTLSAATFLALSPPLQDCALGQGKHLHVPRWMPPSLRSGLSGQLSRAAVEQACARCSTLRELDVSSLARVDDDLVTSVARKCPSLESLRLHDSCSLAAVSTRGIIQLAHLCPALTALDISHADVSDRGVAALCVLSSLKSLRMHGCQRVTGSTLPQVLSTCSKLQRLNLFSSGITPKNISQYLAKSLGTRSLTVNMMSEKDLPALVDVWCGVCNTVLFWRLPSYVAGFFLVSFFLDYFFFWRLPYVARSLQKIVCF